VPIELDRIVIDITGVSPLLQNNPIGSMMGQTAGLGGKTIPTAEQEANRLCYRNKQGFLYIQTVAFRNAMIAAGSGRKVGKMMAKRMVSASIFPRYDQAVLLDPHTNKPIEKYEIFSVPVNIKGRGRVIRSRPRLEEWKTRLELDVNREFLPVGPRGNEIVVELLSIAGQLVGVGDWRVEKNGPYGRFTAFLVDGGAAGKMSVPVATEAPKKKSKKSDALAV
jgi:hypothetical protein